jgi:hypothetical protein
MQPDVLDPFWGHPAMAEIEDFDELVRAAATKRDVLLNKANGRRERRRKMNFTSGALALVSATFIGIIAIWIDGVGLKIFSALLAFASGIISLAMGAFFDEKETAKMFEGAAKYLAFRDKVRSAAAKPEATAKVLHDALLKLRDENAKLGQEFDQYLGEGVSGRIRLPSGDTIQTFYHLR